jgi:phosphate transport system substrate-binding protein
MPVVSSAFDLRVVVTVVAFTTACSAGTPREGSSASTSAAAVIRITGSDTMINVVQALAETYRNVRPDVSVQVAGGGSGVGIAGLIDGILDIAAAGRRMTDEERGHALARNGTAPHEFVVALDAVAVYVHRANPLDRISLAELAEIYGDGGQIQRWSQLSTTNPACRKDQIVRVGRQNSSGTYVYFREAVLGNARDYKLGSIDQSGSKDVVALVSRTPCAIGYSGMAFAVAGVKTLPVSRARMGPGAAPTAATVLDGSYPLARPLYFYTPGEPAGRNREFIEWVLGPGGQRIVRDLGFVGIPRAPGS